MSGIRTTLLLLLPLLTPSGLPAQDRPSEDDPSGRKAPHRIPRAEDEIRVDGVLDEAAWNEALVPPLSCEVRPGILQYSDVDRDLDACDPVNPLPGVTCDLEPESRSLFGQFLFSYEINPRTAFFVGTTDDQLAEEDTDLVRNGRSFFLKLGCAWVP